MPKSAQYVISWLPEQERYFLTKPEEEAYSISLQEEESWQIWLETHHTFAFHGRNGQINLLKEKRNRGNEGYWYAYRRREGRMVKRYVGRSVQLSMSKLEEVVVVLSHEDEAKLLWPSQPPPIPVVPPQFEPLLMPKLQLPHLQKSLLPREHLLELLDRGLECKLTLVAGPAGFGKTTAVNQWITDRSVRVDFPFVASVILDEGDNDPQRFWRYIIAACQKFRAGFGVEALELLLAHRQPPFKPLEMMLTALLNELSLLEHSAVLILDDFHVISSPQVIETLSFFLEHLPTSFHIFVLIRGDSPFSLARLRARNQLLDIYPPHLGFSLEETRKFFEQELAFTLSPKLVRQIYERLEGWPAGTRLLVGALQWATSEQEIELALAPFADSYWSIQDYLLNEILYSLPTEQQEFLLQTSILPRITASLCDAITDRTDSARLLMALRGGDLFLIPLDRSGEWSRYLALFAQTMQQEARKRMGNERLCQLALQASMWFEEHGLLVEAIETSLNTSEWLRITNLIQRFVENNWHGNVFAIPELYSLNRWLKCLPLDVLERNPNLCFYYAMTLLLIEWEGPRFPSKTEHIHHLLQIAEQIWRDANNTAKLAEVFAFQALLARQEGKLLQATTWAKQALAWLPREDRAWRNFALTVVGMGEILNGNLNTAQEFLLEALILCEQQGNLIYARATKGMLSAASFELGALRQASTLYRQMQSEARAQEDSDDIAHTQLGLAHIAYQWNNLEEARRAAQEALEIGEQMEVEEFQALANARLALVDHALGDADQARQRLNTWLTRGQTPKSLHDYQLLREVQATLARIQLASGDLMDVRHWFASIERREEILPLLQYQREQLLWARLLLAQKKEIATTIERLESLCIAAAETSHLYFKMEVDIVLVLAYNEQGLREKARALLSAVLETASSEDYLRLFLDEGEALSSLLRELLPSLRARATLAYAKHLLNAFTQESGTPRIKKIPDTSLLFEPLSVRETKVLRLLAVGNSNAEIARSLVVSVNTVRTQIQSIYRKLNVSNRVEASAVAKQLELL